MRETVAANDQRDRREGLGQQGCRCPSMSCEVTTIPVLQCVRGEVAEYSGGWIHY